MTSFKILNEENALLPDLPPPASIVPLESIVFKADEFESVLKLLPTGKINVKKIAFGNKEHTTDQKIGVSVLKPQVLMTSAIVSYVSYLMN